MAPAPLALPDAAGWPPPGGGGGRSAGWSVSDTPTSSTCPGPYRRPPTPARTTGRNCTAEDEQHRDRYDDRRPRLRAAGAGFHAPHRNLPLAQSVAAQFGGQAALLVEHEQRVHAAVLQGHVDR